MGTWTCSVRGVGRSQDTLTWLASRRRGHLVRFWGLRKLPSQDLGLGSYQVKIWVSDLLKFTGCYTRDRMISLRVFWSSRFNLQQQLQPERAILPAKRANSEPMSPRSSHFRVTVMCGYLLQELQPTTPTASTLSSRPTDTTCSSNSCAILIYYILELLKALNPKP